MRGKTNIPNRKDPIINGDVRNFIVAQNNTIAKGDFVSVVRDSTYRTLSNVSSTYVYKKLYDTVNKKMLVVMQSSNVYYAMILHYTSIGVEVLNQVVLNGVPTIFDFNISTNSLYYVTTTGTQVIHKYSIVNDEIIEQTDIPFTLFTTDTVIGIAVFGNDEHIAFVHRSSSVDDMGYIRICSEMNGSYQLVVTDTQVGYECIYTGSGSDCIVCIARETSSSSIAWLYKFSNYSVQSQTINKDSMSINNTILEASYSVYDIQIIGNSLYYVAGERQTLSSYRYYYRPSFGKVNFLTMTVEFETRYTTNDYASWSVWDVNYFDEDTFIITSVGGVNSSIGGTIIFIVTESEQGVFNVAEAKFTEITYGGGSGAFFEDNDLKIVSYTSNGVLEYSFIVNSLGIFYGEPTNYVKEYDSMYAIGFAKTSGTAGDTIQVYVPHNNS